MKIKPVSTSGIDKLLSLQNLIFGQILKRQNGEQAYCQIAAATVSLAGTAGILSALLRRSCRVGEPWASTTSTPCNASVPLKQSAWYRTPLSSTPSGETVTVRKVLFLTPVSNNRT